MADSLLLVHDDLRVTAVLRRLLSREGYEVALATSVPDAIAACAERRPTLILLAPAVDGGQGKLLLDSLPQPVPRLLLLGEAVPFEGPSLVEAIRKELGEQPALPIPQALIDPGSPSTESPAVAAEIEILRTALAASLERVEEAEREAAVLAYAAHGAETDHADSQLALERKETELKVALEAQSRLAADRAELEAALGQARARSDALEAQLQVRDALLPRSRGWLTSVAPPELPAQLPVVAPALSQAEEQRLLAKFNQIQEADYFAILELEPRSGAWDGGAVHGAYQRLSQEFHLFKYAGLGDPAHLDRAEQIQTVLQEAVQALLDDRLRAEYQRHLALL